MLWEVGCRGRSSSSCNSPMHGFPELEYSILFPRALQKGSCFKCWGPGVQEVSRRRCFCVRNRPRSVAKRSRSVREVSASLRKRCESVAAASRVAWTLEAIPVTFGQQSKGWDVSGFAIFVHVVMFGASCFCGLPDVSKVTGIGRLGSPSW